MIKRHPYITATLVATILSIVVWLCWPKEYTAITKLSDEYKEADVAIGLNTLATHIRDLTGGGVNTGINDVEVYRLILTTETFARQIAACKVPGHNLTYGEYLGKEDTIQQVKDRIAYNYSNQKSVLTVAFTDRDPVVASQMLDSVTTLLQDVINKNRHDIAEAGIRNARQKIEAAKEAYKAAQSAYDEFEDSHINTADKHLQQEESALEHEVKMAYQHYSDACTEYARQQALKLRAHLSFTVLQSNSVPNDNNDYLAGYLLVAIGIVLLAVKGWQLYQQRRREPWPLDMGDLTAPWYLTIAVWATLLIAMQFRDPTLLKAPNSQLYISLLLWILLFSISAFLTFRLMDATREQTEEESNVLHLTDINRKVFYLLLAISIVITPLYVKTIMDVVLLFGTENFMFNVRNYSIFGGAQVGILGYSSVINKTLLLVAVWKFKELKKWQTAWIIIANLLNSLAIMEKGGLFLIFFCIVFVLFIRRIVRVRSVVILMVVMIGLFYLFNLMREEENTTGTSETTLLDFIAMYILSPPVAYCEVVRDLTPQFGGHSFSLAYVFLNRLGFGPFVEFERLQEFVFIPISTNVYTIFQPFFLDFGQKGVAAFAIIYGLMAGSTYRLMRNGNDFGKCMYLYAAHILALQFFQENVFTMNLHVVQLTFFVYLCTQKRFSFSFGKLQYT